MSNNRKELLTKFNKNDKVTIDYNNIANYNDLKNQLRPFDIIAFRGSDFISDLIASLEQRETGCGTFSHVGLVVTSEILPLFRIDGTHTVLEPGKLYVFESTSSYPLYGLGDGVPDVVKKHCKLGVQLRDLEQVIEKYLSSEKTKIAWCKLINNPLDILLTETPHEYDIRKAKIVERFGHVFNDYEGRMYEMDPVGLLSAMFSSLRFIRSIRNKISKVICKGLSAIGLIHEDIGSTTWQFCSELIANIYKEFEVIPEQFDAADVLPVDFFGYDEDGLPALVEKPVFISIDKTSPEQ